jgi:spore germination protein
MRKLLFGLVWIVILVLLYPGHVQAAGITVSLDGEIVPLIDPPILEQGRVLVPLRSIFEKMGATVNWNGALKQVEIKRGSQEIYLPVEGNQAFINGVAYEIDVLPRLEKGRTFVPLRFISQALGARVNWDNLKRHVSVGTDFNNQPLPVWGYYVDHNSYVSLENNLDKINAILPFSYKLDGSQIIENVYFPQGQTLAQTNNIPVYALVFADDQEALSVALASQSNRTALVEQIYDLVIKRGYQGVNLDFERIKAQDRNNYTLFVQELAGKLQPEGFHLSLSVPAKIHDEFSWTKAYDYAALGKLADSLIIMAYDQHYSGSSPGPVASLKWVESVVRYAVSQIDSQKLVLGIGLYGYDWPAGQKGKTVDLAQVLNLPHGEAGWSDEHYTPYYRYNDENDVEHEVWYENRRSIRGKIEVASKYNLAGIALWRLGLVPAEVWNVIAE